MKRLKIGDAQVRLTYGIEKSKNDEYVKFSIYTVGRCLIRSNGDLIDTQEKKDDKTVFSIPLKKDLVEDVKAIMKSRKEAILRMQHAEEDIRNLSSYRMGYKLEIRPTT